MTGELPQPNDKHTDKLREIEKKIKHKDEDYADYKIKKDVEQMEKKGAFNDPDKYNEFTRKAELLEKYEVYETKINKKTEKEIRTGRIITARLGELIYDEGNYFTMLDSREIYSYNDAIGYYQKTGIAEIRSLTEYYLGDSVKEYHKSETVGWIRDHNYIKREEVKVSLDLVNLANGILNIKTMKLLPHSPEYVFLSQLRVNYDPSVSYGIFENFLTHITMKEGKPREKVKKTIQEYFGYGLIRAYPLKYYMVLDGGGDNGKTVLANTVIALFGSDNNTSVSLQDLNSRPFTKKQLYAKHTNVSDDLPKKALKYTGIIKQITGNSEMWADIKGHKDGVNFKNHAKPWYLCNEVPETTDYSDAFFSRQLQHTLLNQYLAKGDKKIDNITMFERDIHLQDKLTTEKQLSGILNYILIGVKRLMKNEAFSDDITTEEKRTIWMRKTNPVHAFIDDEIEISNQDWGITVDDFFSELVEFCKRNEFAVPMARKPVTTRLMDENIGVRKVQKMVNDVPRTWCWIGIKSATNSEINHYFGQDAEELNKEKESYIQSDITASQEDKSENKNIDVSKYKETVRQVENIIEGGHLTIIDIAKRMGENTISKIDFLHGIVDNAISDPKFKTTLCKDKDEKYFIGGQ